VKQPDGPALILPPGSETWHPPVMTPLIRERLDCFTGLLRRWNATIRLVSSRDVGDLWERHILDAVQLAPHIPQETHEAADLGSGGGLPGLVLALATGIHFDLIECDSRKAAFLREAASATEAPITVHACRIEDLTLPPRRLVTARAVAPLNRLLAWAHPLLAQEGVCLFPKGERVEAEVTEAERCWSFTLERLPSRTSLTGRILHISHLTPKLSATA
jgi:16S rRNA (guanine527-N7)-methyltransferase